LNSEKIRLLHDATRLILSNLSLIEENPLQVYCGALVNSPDTSIVRKTFKDQIPSWISTTPNQQKKWSPVLQTIGPGGYGSAATFSWDEKYIAFSYGHTVYVSDSMHGAIVRKFILLLERSKINTVTDLAFSPDNSLLASALSAVVAADLPLILLKLSEP
jgi:WD40 repeat protein